MGTLDDKTATLDIDTGGVLGGPGSLDDWANVNWTGGTISLSGGVTVYTTFTATGSAGLTLSTTLTNEETTNLTGTATIGLGTTGVIDNAAGTLTVAEPIAGMLMPGTTMGVTNSALGILNVPASLSAAVTIRTPFTNDGNLNVGGGSELDLTSPLDSSGDPTINLNGTIALDGNLYLKSTATSTSGFTLSNHSGFFEVGDSRSGTSGTLIVPSGVSDMIQGNLEITGGSSLTGAGTVNNGGLLQLDPSSSTMGLGAYVQSNSGTLAIVVSSMGAFTPLTVTGAAQLSGT